MIILATMDAGPIHKREDELRAARGILNGLALSLLAWTVIAILFTAAFLCL